MKIENGILSGVHNSNIINNKFIIPDSVTKIGCDCFAYCTNLTSIIIPDSVNSIGESAFYNCENLESIIIPNSITEIEYSVFEDCKSLVSIVIPDSITSIGYSAFLNCKKLESKIGNYKAFNKGLICNNMQYAQNEWNTIEGEIKMCEWGLHYVTNLFDIFNYYPGDLEKNIEIWEIEVGDVIVTNEYDSLKATNAIFPKHKLTIKEIINILNNK